jgi:hypothetical protein
MGGCIAQPGLDGLADVETAPVMQFGKMHATMGPRQP